MEEIRTTKKKHKKLPDYLMVRIVQLGVEQLPFSWIAEILGVDRSIVKREYEANLDFVNLTRIRLKLPEITQEKKLIDSHRIVLNLEIGKGMVVFKEPYPFILLDDPEKFRKTLSKIWSKRILQLYLEGVEIPQLANLLSNKGNVLDREALIRQMLSDRDYFMNLKRLESSKPTEILTITNNKVLFEEVEELTIHYRQAERYTHSLPARKVVFCYRSFYQEWHD